MGDMSEKKIVLITGVTSGIGRATAQLLSQKGLTVYGSSRNPSRAEPITGVEILPLNLCSDESVRAFIGTLLKKAGRLDVLVNNAGYGLRGALEEATIRDAKAVFETNLFGAVRLIKAILPIMRNQVSGHIINISSGAGIAPLAMAGFYSASKFALEAYTEVLRHEVRCFNIRVSLVEPGFINTRFNDNEQEASDRLSDYDKLRRRVDEISQRYRKKALEPEAVAKVILKIIHSKSPKMRYTVGIDAAALFVSRRLLPAVMFEKAIRNRLNLDFRK